MGAKNSKGKGSKGADAGGVFVPPSDSAKKPIVVPESIMRKKAHGTSDKPVQDNLRYGCDFKTAGKNEACVSHIWCDRLVVCEFGRL
jgi:hypothetical protein